MPNTPPPAYHPQVAAHDLPPTRDARQAPYAGVIGPGRSNITPEQQVSLAKQTGLVNKPAVQHRISDYLKAIPHQNQPQFTNEAAKVEQAGFLPSDAIPRIMEASRHDPGVMADFPNTGRTDILPALRQAYIAQAKAKGASLPDNPTTAQIYQADYGPKQHHSLLDIATNLPRDLALTPLYAAQGGFALGADMRQHGIAHAAEDFAGQQVAFGRNLLQHPVASFEAHPFQSALGIASLGHGAGTVLDRTGAAGALGIGGELAPRQFSATRFATEGGTPLIDRGTYSSNPWERGGQKLRDLATKKAPAVTVGGRGFDLQGSALSTTARSASATLANQAAKQRADIARPVQEAYHNLGRGRGKQATAILGNEALGMPGGVRAPMEAKHQAYNDAARTAEGQSAGILQNLNLLGDYSKYRRDYHPLATKLAAQGDKTAENFLAADKALEEAHNNKADLAEPMANAKKALTALVAKHSAAGGEAPYRVPFASSTPVRDRLPGIKRGVGLKSSRFKHYTGARYASGDFAPPTHEAFIRGIEEPSQIENLARQYNHISNPENGIAVHAVPGKPIPENMVLQRVTGAHSLEHPQEAVKPLQSLASTLDDQATHVPTDGAEYRLWPRPVANEMLGRIAETGGPKKTVRSINSAIRHVQLYSRLAYPFTNTLDNATRATLLEGVGPASYLRSRRNSGYATPPEVGGHGVAAMNLGRVSARNPVRGYTELVRRASVSGEDATRRSVYLKNAVPAARKFGETKAVLARWAAHDFHSEAERLAAHNAIDKTNRVLGDFGAMSRHIAVDAAFPYNMWPRFVAKNMTTTLPLYYPGRTLGVYRMGQYGQQAQNQMGTLSPALQGIVPVAGNEKKQLVAQTSYPLAYGTLGSMLMPSYHGTLQPRGVLSYSSPIISQGLGALTGHDLATDRMFTNAKGEGILASDRTHPASPTPLSDWLRMEAAQAVNQFPLARAFGAQNPNASDTSIPLPGLSQSSPPPPGGAGRFATPLWMALLNTAQPFRLSYQNLPALAQKGDTIYAQNLSKQAATEAKAREESAVAAAAAKAHVKPGTMAYYAIAARVAGQMASSPKP
jgi:hypothetical protein